MSADDQTARLLSMTQGLYHALLDALPVGRGHCREVADMASSLALAMGLTHRWCAGRRRMPDGTDDLHSWIVIGDKVLHSPKPGHVELADPAPFETTTVDYTLTAGER